MLSRAAFMGGDNVDEGWIVGYATKGDGREGVARILCFDDVIERIGCYYVALFYFVDCPCMLGWTNPGVGAGERHR